MKQILQELIITNFRKERISLAQSFANETFGNVKTLLFYVF